MPNSTILSASVNQNFTDIATGLSDCLTRDGQAGMSAVLKAVSGSVSAPGITFNSDATAGLYLSSTGIVGLVAKSLGLLVNSSIYAVASAAVQAGGSNYVVGEQITLTGGTFILPVVLTVATLSGSAVATVTVGYAGAYSVKPSNPVSQASTDGSGTGATFNLTFAAQFASSIVTDESGNVPWQRLGASSFVSGIMANPNAYDFLKAIATAGSGISFSRSTSPPTITATLSPPLVPNYLSGLTLSTAGSSGTMSIAAGVANDSTNVTLMNLASSISKTTASWAVGTGNGGIDTGAIAGSTWYHFYEIERTDTGVVDIIFSLSASSPALPTNYTLYRRIGSGKTDGSNHWTAFTQTGNIFIWAAAQTDVNNTATTASRVLTTLTVPTGIVVTALFRGNTGTNGGTTATIFTSPQENDQAASGGGGGLSDLSALSVGWASGDFERLTNTSAQIGVRSANTTGLIAINTYGWKDTRGQQ